MADLREFHGPNAGYVLDLYERFLRDPESVDGTWRAFFAGFNPSRESPLAGSSAAGISPELVIGARELADAIRARGHTAARTDPLGVAPEPDQTLQPGAHGVAEADLGALPAASVGGPAARGAGNAAAAVDNLREIYCGTAGYEWTHLPDAAEREWMREQVESGRFHGPLTPEERRALLERLSQTEGFERYLHKAFFGQKRFSIEGTDALVPMLDEAIRRAGDDGARQVVIGMAHRGRLNVLAHVVGKPYAKMVAGFVGTTPPEPQPIPAENAGRTGDVKYHMGWSDVWTVDGREIQVCLASNPSHLEFVAPVATGMVRAAQDRTDAPGLPVLDPAAALAVLVHGDAAFPGQGVVAETFNLAALPGYTVGGTLHVISNNQVGFTTDADQGRSTRYASDLAKGFDVPVVHVNADDVQACVQAVRLGWAYRQRFGKDFLIDLVGYRRWGHNEGDEPAFTQPVMYDAIREHSTARERFSAELVEGGEVTQADADAMLQAVLDRMGEAHASLAEHTAQPAPSPNGRRAEPTATAVSAQTLQELNEALLSWPGGFTLNTRLERLLERRRDALHNAAIDWGHSEALAFASLLVEGTPIRLTGQDAERGTFSHRHAVLHDAATGAMLTPLATLPEARASFEVRNSPLSETACLGFEYGYSVFDPAVLVLWEAQFGDFANGAQVIIDQFLAAGEQKWGQTSGLVLLLPHGYEGQGPEHSSARLERFLQLAAEGNLRVANCTTAAQYFHLLRRQAASLDGDRRPLVVLAPKSLLRHPLAASSLEQLAEGRFHPVLPDPSVTDRADAITRLLLCSGKVYVDVVGSTDEQRSARANIPGRDRVALARVEELYPFPAGQLTEMLAGFPALREVVWVQEEPRNMGAWTFVEPRLRGVAGDLPVRYVGRPERASPAEGFPARHSAEQERIVAAAWGDAPKQGRSGARGERREKQPA